MRSRYAVWKTSVPSIRRTINRMIPRRRGCSRTIACSSPAWPAVDPATGKVPDDPAAQVDLALDRVEAVVKAAGLELSQHGFRQSLPDEQIPSRIMNEHYARRFEFGNTPARATIEVSSLPGGAHIEYTGVAVRDLKQRRAVRPKNMPPSPTASPCVFAGDTLYCSAKSGFIPGPHGGVYASTTPHQLRQTMRNLLDNLEEAEMKFDQVVSTNCLPRRSVGHSSLRRRVRAVSWPRASCADHYSADCARGAQSRQRRPLPRPGAGVADRGPKPGHSLR